MSTDIPDLIAGALGVSRGTAYDIMREVLAEQSAQYPEGDVVGPCVCGSWPGGKCLKCPRIEQPAQQEPVVITEKMAFAFHNAITDGALGTDDMMDIMRGLEAAFAHITTPQPAQRTWVGLTKKDVYECEPKTDWYDSVEFAQAIEAKLKEKNDG